MAHNETAVHPRPLYIPAGGEDRTWHPLISISVLDQWSQLPPTTVKAEHSCEERVIIGSNWWAGCWEKCVPSHFMAAFCQGISRAAVDTCPPHRAPKSREILMFVCLQKDAKQCCEVTEHDCTHCSGRRRSRRPEQ